MSDPVKPVTNYNDLGSLTALARQSKTGSAASLRETARQFESLFTRMMLKSMREASFEDPNFGSDESKFYRDMFDDQLSVKLSSGRGIGLADMLVRQLSQGRGAAASPAQATSAAGGSAAPAPIAPAASAVPAATSAPVVPAVPGVPAVPAATAASTATAALTTRPAATDASEAPVSQGKPTASTTASRNAFVRELWPSATAAARALGVDPRSLLAQAALETNWGQSLPAGLPDTAGSAGPCSNNLFGIKASGGWSGAAVAARTVEFSGGVPGVRTEKFRSYASRADCLQDYVALLKDNPRYARALGTGGDVQAFGSALQQAGYATDPQYGNKLAAVARSLNQFVPQPLTPSQGAT